VKSIFKSRIQNMDIPKNLRKLVLLQNTTFSEANAKRIEEKRI